MVKDFFNIPMKYRRLSTGQQYFWPDGVVARQGLNGEYDGGRIIMEALGGEILRSVRANFFNISQSNKVRISLTGSTGYQSSSIVTNRNELKLRSFMQSASDLGNVEITFAFVYNGGGDEDCNVFLSGRGGKHTPARPCEGCSYKAILPLKSPSVTKIAKEPSNNFFPSGSIKTVTNTKFTSPIEGKLLFLKLCIYDLDIDYKPTLDKTKARFVKIEFYGGIETSVGSGNFKEITLLHQQTDKGDWSTGAVACGASSESQILIWDSPLVSIGWEGFPNIDFKDVSFGEIDPTTDINIPLNTTIEIPPADEPPSPSTGEELNDINGVKKIYKSKEGGSDFTPDTDNLLGDNRFSKNGANVTSVGNGVYQVQPGTTRILFYSTPEARDRDGADGEHTYDDYPTHNFEELRKKGSWDAPATDFHNLEYTVYINHIKAANPDNDEISLAVRSVRHEETSHNGCGGSSYHGNIFLNGLFRFKKEQRHVDYDSKPANSEGIGNITGKTIGLKFMCYDLPDNSVKLEMWADKDNKNIWKKYHEMIDKDDWGVGMKTCGALKAGASILWGSPKVILKCNNQKFNFERVSVREIQGGEILVSQAPTGGGSTGNLSRQTSNWIFLWDHITDTSGTTCIGDSTPPVSTYTEKYSVTDVTDDKQLSGNFTAEDDRTRVGILCKNTTSKIYRLITTRAGFLLRKHNSPTGTLYFEIWDNNRPTPNTKMTFGTLDVSTLGTSYSMIEKTKDDAKDSIPLGLQAGWIVGVRYEGGDSSNYVEVGVNYDNPFDSTNTIEIQYEKENGTSYSVVEHSDRDCCGKLYVSP